MVKKSSAVILAATWVLTLGTLAYMCMSCPSIPLHYRAFEGPRAGPGDCFPLTEAGEGSGSGQVAVAEIDESLELPFELGGTWAQQQRTTTMVNAPLIGEVRTTMTNTLLMEVTQSGNRIEMSALVCGISSESSSSAAHTIVPQSFIDAIGLSDRHAVV